MKVRLSYFIVSLVSAKVKNGKKQLPVQDSRRVTGDPGTEEENKSEREIKTASTSIKPSSSQTLLEGKSGLWKYISIIVKKAQNIFSILNFDLLGLFTDNPFFSRSWSGLRKPSCLITTQSICYEQDIPQKNFFMGARKNGRTTRRHATPRVSPSRTPVLSCAQYFQAPATQVITRRQATRYYSLGNLGFSSFRWLDVFHGMQWMFICYFCNRNVEVLKRLGPKLYVSKYFSTTKSSRYSLKYLSSFTILRKLIPWRE